jgi:hypothetical protein
MLEAGETNPGEGKLEIEKPRPIHEPEFLMFEAAEACAFQVRHQRVRSLHGRLVRTVCYRSSHHGSSLVARGFEVALVRFILSI